MPLQATVGDVSRRQICALQARGHWLEPSCAHQARAAKTVPHLRKRGGAPSFGLRLATAVHGWQRLVVPNTCPSQSVPASPMSSAAPWSGSQIVAGCQLYLAESSRSVTKLLASPVTVWNRRRCLWLAQRGRCHSRPSRAQGNSNDRDGLPEGHRARTAARCRGHGPAVYLICSQFCRAEDSVRAASICRPSVFQEVCRAGNQPGL